MTKDSDLNALSKEIVDQKQTRRRALRLLLDDELNSADNLLVQRSRMGGTESFVGSVTLEWFAAKVRFAKELGLFKHNVDEAGRLIIDEETIEEIQQRELDYSRQAPLAKYLAGIQDHKFPPVLAVVTRDWVDDPKADEWDASGKAIGPPVKFTGLDSDGRVGLLELSSDVFIYALDGQHRLLGVQGLIELVKAGRLARRKKNGAYEKTFLTTDDLREDYQTTDTQLQALTKEKIGIEFLAAVMPGETREEAKRRVRSIFVHVNTMAAKLSPSQLAQLDEDFGAAIVGRHAAVIDPLLVKRVDFSNRQLKESSEFLTTLHAVKEMARGYLVPKFPTWEPDEKNMVPMRPSEDDLKQGADLFVQFLSELSQLPSLRKVLQGGMVSAMRGFDDGGEGHLLVRPIGPQMLAEAVGAIEHKGHDLKQIFRRIKKFDSEGGFSHINQSQSIWWGPVYDGKKVKTGISKTAVNLMVYLFGGGISDDTERERLRAQFQASRTFDQKTITLSGKYEPADIYRLELPPYVTA